MVKSAQFFPPPARIPAHKVAARELLLAIDRYDSACLKQKDPPGKNGIKKKLELLTKISALDAETDTFKAGAIFIDICDFVLVHTETSRLIDYVKEALVKILRIKIDFSQIYAIRDQEIKQTQYLPSNISKIRLRGEAYLYCELAKKELINHMVKKAIKEFKDFNNAQIKLSLVKSINHLNIKNSK